VKPNFKRDLEAGKSGEAAVQKLWPELVLLNGKGADAVLPNGELVEIKCDRYDHSKTSNFFIEYLGDIESGKLGGPYKAEQDGCEWFVYYFQNPGIAYVFNVHDLLYELQTYILVNNPSLVEIKNSRWTTVGRKIPRSALTPVSVLHSTPNKGK
jgi:hypothetical protein